MLGLAIDFFLTERGARVAEHLAVCWDTADNLLHTRLANAGIALEGMLRIVGHDSGARHSGCSESDQEAFARYINDNPDELSDSFCNRLRGWFGTVNQRRAVDVLRDWEARDVLSVVDEDIRAWGRVRHGAAHAGTIGAADDREALQQRVSDITRVHNLMNRVALALIGFRGQYVDYVQDGWPNVEFPSVSVDDL